MKTVEKNTTTCRYRARKASHGRPDHRGARLRWITCCWLFILIGAGVATAADNDPGVITTVAGTGIAGFSGDGGPAEQARLWSPFDVAVDESGNLFISDRDNQRVRRVEAGRPGAPDPERP